MYDFDMNKLLKNFDGDPEALANAFASQLNTALEEKRKDDELHKIAEEIHKNWQLLVENYFEINKLDKENIGNFIFRSGDEVIDFLKIMIAALPEIEKYIVTFEKINATTEKIANMTQDKLDDFQKTMKEFFKHNDI